MEVFGEATSAKAEVSVSAKAAQRIHSPIQQFPNSTIQKNRRFFYEVFFS